MSLVIRSRLDRPGFRLDVDLDLPAEGITTLWGPSGCGKTTLLRCLAGLEPATVGRIALAGRIWLDTAAGIDLPPHRRAVGCVFQDGQLFPHLDVRGNLLFGRRRGAPGKAALDFAQAVDLLGLKGLLERRPAELSGGQKQRTALGRALLAGPEILLLDEPLASVDAAGRTAIYPCIEAIASRGGVPILHVTHDGREAARLADRAAIMQDGRILACGPLTEVMTDLDLPWAAGDDPVAVVAATASGRDPGYHLNRLEFAGGELWLPGPPQPRGRTLRVVIAARDVSLALTPPADTSILNVLPAVVREFRPRNESQVIVKLAVGATLLLGIVTRRSADALTLGPGRELFAQVKSVALV